jgi:hypothetical protein
MTKRKPNGTWAKGYSGNTDGAGGRARRELNADTIREMHRAFREHGRQAIDKVIRTQPAAFLKLLVLLIPREFQIERSSAIKSMTDEQLEEGLEMLKRYMAAKAAALGPGAGAKVVEGVGGPATIPPTKRKRRRTEGPQCGNHPTNARGVPQAWEEDHRARDQGTARDVFEITCVFGAQGHAD